MARVMQEAIYEFGCDWKRAGPTGKAANLVRFTGQLTPFYNVNDRHYVVEVCHAGGEREVKDFSHSDLGYGMLEFIASALSKSRLAEVRVGYSHGCMLMSEASGIPFSEALVSDNRGYVVTGDSGEGPEIRITRESTFAIKHVLSTVDAERKARKHLPVRKRSRRYRVTVTPSITLTSEHREAHSCAIESAIQTLTTRSINSGLRRENYPGEHPVITLPDGGQIEIRPTQGVLLLATYRTPGDTRIARELLCDANEAFADTLDLGLGDWLAPKAPVIKPKTSASPAA